MGYLPQEMLSRPQGDGHNASITEPMKESEDESFRFVFTWIDSGDGRKGWTTHYIPKHLPLSNEVSSVMEFLGLRTFAECPEADFEACQWRFLHFIPGHDYGFNGPAEIAHKWFGAHETKFSKGIANLTESRGRGEFVRVWRAAECSNQRAARGHSASEASTRWCADEGRARRR